MRLMNQYFPTAQLDLCGQAYNALIKKSDALMAWTEGRIFRTAAAALPASQMPVPFILNNCLAVGSIFLPGGKERNTLICNTLMVFEEPAVILDDEDITIVSVSDEWKRILLTDPYLKLDSSSPAKTERLHKFQLQQFDAKQEDPSDTVTFYAGFRAEYLIDLDYKSRQIL